VTIHNIFTFHESPDKSQAIVSFHRPQDWGNPQEWQYIQASVSVPNDDPLFRSRCCHIWVKPRRERFEFLREIGGLLFSFYYPGKPLELCDRSHLAADDHWCQEWGKMPPEYDGNGFDPLDDSHAEMGLEHALNNPCNIPIALTPEYATIVASLMQFGLRHPGVKTMTPQLYQLGRPFVETLIDRLVAKSPEHGDKIRSAFDRAWNESNDLTAEEFDALGVDFEIKPESNN
jgi:hypothetical protein